MKTLLGLFCLLSPLTLGIRRYALPTTYFQVGLVSADCSAAQDLSDDKEESVGGSARANRCEDACNSMCAPTTDPKTYRECLKALGPECLVPGVLAFETPSEQEGYRSSSEWVQCVNTEANYIIYRNRLSSMTGQQANYVSYRTKTPLTDPALCEQQQIAYVQPRSGVQGPPDCSYQSALSLTTSPIVDGSLVLLPVDTMTTAQAAVFDATLLRSACGYEDSADLVLRRHTEATFQGVESFFDIKMDDDWY